MCGCGEYELDVYADGGGGGGGGVIQLCILGYTMLGVKNVIWYVASNVEF